MERSKKRVQIWKKAAVHFLLCFVMGFFTGFAPTGRPANYLTPPMSEDQSHEQIVPRPVQRHRQQAPENVGFNPNRTLSESSFQPNATEDSRVSKEDHNQNQEIDRNPRRQIIIVTPTTDKNKLRNVLLRRLASTLKLVPPPLLWIVVESNSEFSGVSEVLRRTRVMYRHLVVKENFTDIRKEMDHQRNMALNHIEHHRLSGIVHFAGLSNVYDLGFFDEIRAIEVFGTWPIVKLSTRRKKSIIEGPVCRGNQVVGWHLKKGSNQTPEEFPIHISSFGFNSSILWDPERWGRLSSSAQDSKQNSLKFVKQAVFDDDTKLRGVPHDDCSKVNLWQFHLPTLTASVDHIPATTDQTRR